MDEREPPVNTHNRRWWVACILILPISIFVIIWVFSYEILIGRILGYSLAAFIIASIALVIFGIPLAVDDEYREQFFNWFRRRGQLPEPIPYHDEILWEDTNLTQVWPTIRSETGEIVSIPRNYSTPDPPLLPIIMIQQRIPELEAAIEALDTNRLTASIIDISPQRAQEQLQIERSVANTLLASLVIQRGKKNLNPNYYTRKRRQLLRTIARIDEKLDGLSNTLTE